MPDEKDPKETNEDSKVNDALELLSKKIDEQASKHDMKLSSVDKKITDLNKPDDKEVDEDWSTGDDDDEEVLVKKSELKSIVDTAVKKATEAASKAAEKTVGVTLSARAKRDEIDLKAFKDFPYLHRASDDFNERFEKEVTDEMKRKVDNGRSNADPELLYDAAAVVAQRGRSAGWLATKEDAERFVDRGNARSESFSVHKRKHEGSDKPSADQTAFATQLGLTPKRFAELFGKTSKSKLNSVDSDN